MSFARLRPLRLPCFVSALVSLASATAWSAPGVIPLTVVDARAHDVEIARPEPGEIVLKATGGDPFVFAEAADGKPFDVGGATVLAFEYTSPTGTNAVEVAAEPPPKPRATATDVGLTVAKQWTPRSVDLRPALVGVKQPMKGLRIDFGDAPGKTMSLRSVVIRPPNKAELQARAAKDAVRAVDAAKAEKLTTYLAAKPGPASVTGVHVDDAHVRIEGTIGRAAAAGVTLVEVPLWGDPTDLSVTASRQPIAAGADGTFDVSLDRMATLDGRAHDRLLSRWLVAEPSANKAAGGLARLSAAQWADDVAAPADAPPAVKPKSKKGLGGFHVGRLNGDLDELNIGSVTVNVPISAYMRTAGGPGLTSFEYAGRTWWTVDGAVAGMDATMLEAAKRGIVVSAIVLVSQPGGSPAGSFARTVAHPDADPSAYYVMPNFTTRDGCEAYAASLEFLARRYGRPDGKFGRIHHYILHNEVDAGWVWTNAGEKAAQTYMDLYQRSMRTAHLVARQHDPHAKAFISLTHQWTDRGEARWYGSKALLDLMTAYSKAEGDFDWAIAFHPYPQSLRNPRTWEDNQATFAIDSPKITFKNLEVLDAWARRPTSMYLGKTVRTIHLTEQGLNSKDYSETALKDQAAGLAFAWQKIARLDSIEAFQYHNWIDNRGEGGLRIGLRRFPDDQTDPLGPKPIWHLYKALGTPAEAEAAAAYLPVVGIKSWEEAQFRGPIQ